MIASRHRCVVGATVLTAVWLTGCGDKGGGNVTRLNPRGVPYLDGVPVPGKFELVDKMTEDYESGGQRIARHEYRGSADPQAVRNFYREQMPLQGWTRVSDQNVKGEITVRFEKKSESCTLVIQSSGTLGTEMFGRTTVRVILMPFNRSTSEPPKRPVP